MKLVDNKGIMLFPNPIKQEVLNSSKVLVVTECFCPNGHNLINKTTNFNGFKGILLKAEHKNDKGYVALSPVFGDKSRVFVSMEVEKGDVIKLSCPVCDAELPEIDTCKCGSKTLGMFTTQKLELSNCIGFCNRVDCVNADLVNDGQKISLSNIDANSYL